MQINVYTDGGSRGNPGVSGYGIVVLDEKKHLIYQEAKYLGVKTNNEAEYLALLGALSWIQANYDGLQINQITFHADSQLLLRQLQGVYKVKSPHLKPLNELARNIIKSLNTTIHYQEIPRELNSQADALANQAMDQGL